MYKVSILLQLKGENPELFKSKSYVMTLLFLPFVLKSQTKKTTLETGFPKPQIICIRICVIKYNPMRICVPVPILAVEMLVNMSQHLIITKYNICACYYLDLVV